MIVRPLMGFPLIESGYQEEEKEKYGNNHPRVGHQNQVDTYHVTPSPLDESLDEGLGHATGAATHDTLLSFELGLDFDALR